MIHSALLVWHLLLSLIIVVVVVVVVVVFTVVGTLVFYCFCVHFGAGSLFYCCATVLVVCVLSGHIWPFWCSLVAIIVVVVLCSYIASDDTLGPFSVAFVAVTVVALIVVVVVLCNYIASDDTFGPFTLGICCCNCCCCYCCCCCCVV